MKSISTIIFSLCLAALQLGCKKDNPNSTLTDPAARKEIVKKNGWTEYTVAGMAISFPKGWRALDLTQSLSEKGMDKVFGNEPKFAPMRAQVQALEKSGTFKLFVFNLHSLASGFGTNCNIAVHPGAGSMTIEQVAEASKMQISAMVSPGTSPDLTYQDLPVGRVAVLQSTLMSAGLGKDLASRAYIVKHGGDVVGITFSCSDAEKASVNAAAQEVMQTLRFSG